MPTQSNEDRVLELANKVARVLNGAQHPADALTALQYVVAGVIDNLKMDPDMFFTRVRLTVSAIASGQVPTKEPA